MRMLAALAFVVGLASAQEVDALRLRIESLRPVDHVWRAVKWESCLLEGLERSRKEQKPILLWVFLHHPADERC